MVKFINIIKNSPLFSDISENEVEVMLPCLSAVTKSYEKGETVFHIGDTVSSVGIVLCGSVNIEKDDFWGKHSILSHTGIGGIFGETYACVKTQPLNVNVIAAQDTEILFLDIQKVMTTCNSACKFHARLIQNMLLVLAQRNLTLKDKLEHMSQRTTREKLMSYLSEQVQKNQSPVFVIPFNRQQLSDYLSVDRSAMSAELCKLRDEGILKFSKNKFELL